MQVSGKPFFSVIVPVSNRAYCIGHCLDSIFAQTCQDFELIVVDDGSTDASADIIRGYGDRVRFMQQANAGLGLARGVYVVFFDNDDLWTPCA